jgi:hypothetical protein
MKFDWSYARSLAAAKGMTLVDEIAQQADARFAEIGLTQHQVDCVLQVHLHHIAWLFTPKRYTLRGRIALAWHFLFGKGVG